MARSEKMKNVMSTMAKINKKFGENTISFVSDIEDQLKREYVESPSWEFNTMLYGGLSKGKIAEFYGNPGSGKTKMALEIIRSEQQKNPEHMTAWIETEDSITIEDFEDFGIDTERVLYLKQTESVTAEILLDVIRGIIPNVDIITVNSIAALVAKREVEDESEKQQMALIARLLSKTLRTIVAGLSTHKTTIILINQVRSTMDQYSPTATTGGKAIPFYANQRVEFRREKIRSEDVITEDDGVKIKCKVSKNRWSVGNPFKVCNYYALYQKGIDTTSELCSVLFKEGILLKGGAWFRYEDIETGDPKVLKINGEDIVCKWNGNAKVIECFRQYPEVEQFFVDLLKAKFNSGNVGQDVSDEEKAELERMNQEIEGFEEA